MILKTRFALSLIIFTLAVSLHAQEHAIISALKKKYHNKASLELIFDLDIFWKVREKHEKKSGSLCLVPGDKFRLTIGSSEFISDGDTYWQYNEKASQLIIKNILDLNLSMHPSQVIKTYLEHNYTIESENEKTALLTWAAKKPGQKSLYKSMSLQVNKKKNIIEKIKIIDKNGNESTYTFKKTRTDAAFPSSLFEFKPPKGVDVLDSR